MGMFTFFRRPRVEDTGLARMELTEVPADQLGTLIKDAATKAAQVEQEYRRRRLIMKARVDDVKRALTTLDRASFSGEQRLTSSVNMAKEAFVKRAQAALSLPYPDTLNATQLRGLEGELGKLTSYFNTVSPKQLFYLSTYFKPQTQGVIDMVREMNTEVQGFGAFSQAGAQTLATLEALKEKTGGLAERAMVREKLAASHARLEKEMEKLAEKKAAAEQERAGFIQSKQWGDIERLEGVIEEREQEREMLRTGFSETVAGCEKAFAKAFHGSKTTVYKETFEDMLKGEDGLAAACTQALAKADRLKPAEVKKIKALQGMLSRREELKAKDRKLAVEAAELERTLKRHAGFFERKQETEKELEDTEKRLAEGREELQKLTQQLSSLEQADTSEKAQVEQLLEAGGKRIKIV